MSDTQPTLRSSTELRQMIAQLELQHAECETRVAALDAEAGQDYEALAAGGHVTPAVQKELDQVRDRGRALAAGIERARIDLVAAEEREQEAAVLQRRELLLAAIRESMVHGPAVTRALKEAAKHICALQDALIAVGQATPRRFRRPDNEEVVMPAEGFPDSAFKFELTPDFLKHAIELELCNRLGRIWPYAQYPMVGVAGNVEHHVRKTMASALSFFDQVHSIQGQPGLEPATGVDAETVATNDAYNEALIAAEPLAKQA